MLKIAIDMTVSPTLRTGIGRYTTGLLSGLCQLAGEDRYLIILGQNQADLFPECTDRLSAVGVRGSSDQTIRNHFWRWFVLPKLLKSEDVDLLHLPSEKPIFRRHIPTVMTVHDIGDFRLAARASRLRRSVRRFILPWTLRTVNHIIAVSNKTREDLIEILEVPSERITVIGEAVGAQFEPTGRASARKHICEKWGISNDIVLFVGELDTRKNIDNLIGAFEIVLKRHRKDVSLVIVGVPARGATQLYELVRMRGLSESTYFTGYIEERELLAFYKSAQVLVLPSMYEGFGLPVVEAMACGTPVIASRSGSLPEIVGNAGILVNPGDVGDIADAIMNILTSPDLRGRLVEEGLRKSMKLSWTAVAEATQQVYTKVISDARSLSRSPSA